MNGFSGAILALGVAGAAFLYWKSKQDQAAALAAAQNAPGPGLVQKAENTVKLIFSKQTGRAVAKAGGILLDPRKQIPLIGHAAGSIASGVGSVVHSIGGLL